MYGWDFMQAIHQEAADQLPPDGALALMEFMTAASLNPWGIGDPPGGRWDHNMPTVPFGPQGQGMVTYLIRDDERMLYITSITWTG